MIKSLKKHEKAFMLSLRKDLSAFIGFSSASSVSKNRSQLIDYGSRLFTSTGGSSFSPSPLSLPPMASPATV